MSSNGQNKHLELGVFLPIAQNGFVTSSNAPAYYPSYEDNLAITLAAEKIGFDQVFSMAKWRGFGGRTQFWDASFESFSLMAALAAATRRIGLIATVNPLLFHPTLMSKMAATIDHVSRGRLGLNIITGAILGEYSQMGVIPPGYDNDRYTYAAEWIQALKRLWTEPRVTHRGKYFQLEDCVSNPKPHRRPHPFLVCAASSDEGLRFTANEVDYSFISGRDIPELQSKALRAKELAVESNRRIKTAALLMLVMGNTPQDSAEYWDHLVKGADAEALHNAGWALTKQTRAAAQKIGAERLASDEKIFFGMALRGSPEEIAPQLIELVRGGDIDNLLLMFPDYLAGLNLFEAKLMPLLRKAFDVGQNDVRGES